MGLIQEPDILWLCVTQSHDIRLDKGKLIINIKDDATETGIVSCFQDGRKVSDIELNTGNNIVNLNPKMEYKISVEAEEFNLKPYKVNK